MILDHKISISKIFSGMFRSWLVLMALVCFRVIITSPSEGSTGEGLCLSCQTGLRECRTSDLLTFVSTDKRKHTWHLDDLR